jgi:hypothetical protein
LGLALPHATHLSELALAHAALHHLARHALPTLHPLTLPTLEAALTLRTVLALHAALALCTTLTHALSTAHAALAFSPPAAACASFTAASIAALHALTRAALLHPGAALTTLTLSALTGAAFARPTLTAGTFPRRALRRATLRASTLGGALPALARCELFEQHALKFKIILQWSGLGDRCWGGFDLVLRIHHHKGTGERGRSEG